jgi:hypothetical protein
VLEIAEADAIQIFGDFHYATALSNYTWLAFFFNSDLKSVKAGPQQVLLTVCFASALYNNNYMAFVLTSFSNSQSGTTAGATNKLFCVRFIKQ